MSFGSNGTFSPYKSKMEGDMKNEGWLGNLPINNKKKGKEKYLWCSWAREKIPMNSSNMRKRRKDTALGHTFLSQPNIQFLLSIPTSVLWAHWALMYRGSFLY